MSLASIRAQFKTVLDTVTDVQGFVHRPGSATEGDAWPILRTGVRDPAAGLYRTEWQVGVFLPQDREAADDWIDSHVLTIANALLFASLGIVDVFEPANFGDDNNYVYGLLLTLESDY